MIIISLQFYNFISSFFLVSECCHISQGRGHAGIEFIELFDSPLIMFQKHGKHILQMCYFELNWIHMLKGEVGLSIFAVQSAMNIHLWLEICPYEAIVTFVSESLKLVSTLALSLTKFSMDMS